MIRKALFVMAAVGAMTLAGCEIYFGPGNPPPDCSPWGCYDPPPPPPFGECNTNYDCAAGCYCTPEGYCAEAGFCQADWECPYGFVCDERSSCVPARNPGTCNTNDDCPYGSFCDETGGYCIPSWTCWGDDECGPGFTCDYRGTCVPVPCSDNSDCLEGCYCDVDSGQCIETGFCRRDSDCFDGMVCDERNTCVPPTPPPPPDRGSCNGEIICRAAAPDCPQGMTPGIADGCYTGYCIPLEECTEPPLARCEMIENQNQCFNRADCYPTYIGVNCTCNGTPCICSDTSANCVCERYEYAGCVSI